MDAVKSVRGLAAGALVVIAASAYAFAAYPIFIVAAFSRVAMGVAGITLALALVALSLGLAGRGGLARRLGRNAAFASAGTGIAAGLMGLSGYYLSGRAVFYIAAALTIPAIVALICIRPEEVAPASDAAQDHATGVAAQLRNALHLLRRPQFAIFAVA